MYEGKLSNIESSEIFPSWLDDYKRGDLGFEIVCSLPIRNEAHRLLLIMYAHEDDLPRVTPGERDLGSNNGWSDDPVFVKVREIAEVGEHVVFRPIPTVVRLKLLNGRVRGNGKMADVIKAQPFVKGVAFGQPLTSNREGDGLRDLRPHCETLVGDMPDIERPSDMVKGCVQIREDVPNNQGPLLFLHGLNSHGYDITEILKLACFPNGNLWLEQPTDTPFERLDVYIRPLNLELGAAKWMSGGVYYGHEPGIQATETKDAKGSRDTDSK